MRPLVIVLVLLAVSVSLAGCGVRPSGAIKGVPAPDGDVEGTVLFLLSGGRPTAVVRPSTVAASPIEALKMLAAGPNDQERVQGLTSEVPQDAVPADVSVGSAGATVTLSINASGLSTVAIEQIACTVAPEVPVIVVGNGQRRDPVSCAG